MHVALVKEDLKKAQLIPYHKIIWYIFALKHKIELWLLCIIILLIISALLTEQLLPNDTEINDLRSKL